MAVHLIARVVAMLHVSGACVSETERRLYYSIPLTKNKPLTHGKCKVANCQHIKCVAARSGQSGLTDQAERPEAEHHRRTMMSPLVTGEMAGRIQDVDPGV